MILYTDRKHDNIYLMAIDTHFEIKAGGCQRFFKKY